MVFTYVCLILFSNVIAPRSLKLCKKELYNKAKADASWSKSYSTTVCDQHHHHQVPDLEQTLAAMPLQTSLSSDNFKKFIPLLCPPVAELQRLSRNVILCLPLPRLPSTFPVKDKNSKPLFVIRLLYCLLCLVEQI